MTSRRTELPHNTPEQVREYLTAALVLVDELNPPHDLRAAVFTEAARLVSSKQIMLEQVAPGILGGVPLRGA